MKIFPVKKIAEIDRYTIENEPVASIDLMERAALAFVDKFLEINCNKLRYVDVFVGPGNNGGDALAIARLLVSMAEKVRVWVIVTADKLSADSKINLRRLKDCKNIVVKHVYSVDDIEVSAPDSLIIDGLFGSGLNRPLEGWPKEVVQYLNALPNKTFAIDISSGLMGEDNSGNDLSAVVKADYTITFQMPKLAFLLSGNEDFVGSWHLVDIGLHKGFINSTETKFYYSQQQDFKTILKKRKPFAHKGHFGHALLLAGSYGKMGAAVLASKACLKSGVGLLITHVPRLGYGIIQTAVPEAMASIDRSDILISEHPSFDNFSAVGVGPGIGTKQNTTIALLELLQAVGSKPVVLDADAINILSQNERCMNVLPQNSVLTPHPGELDRLLGASDNSYKRLQKAIAFAKEKKVVVVLKGAYTAVIDVDGSCYFNSSGNAGMATAGSGDVLTGIILSFLAQGYKAIEAARMSVYIHGLAADIFVRKGSMESLTAGDIVDNLNLAFKQFWEK